MGVCDDLVVIYVIYIDLKSSCVSIFFGHPEMRYITDAKHITVAWWTKASPRDAKSRGLLVLQGLLSHDFDGLLSFLSPDIEKG